MADAPASGQGPPISASGFELMFAPLLIGVVLNALLYGVFIMQVHSYFHQYKTDFSWIRYLIYYLIVMETVNTVCDVGLIYEPLITLRYSDLAIKNSPRLLAADPIVTTLISTPSQLFMAWRIRLVTKSTWLAALVALLAFSSLVGGTLSTIFVALHPPFSDFHTFQAPLTLWLTSTAFADLFITAFMVNFLWVNKTGFKTQTDSVTDKIIFFTVQTGTITSFAAIADVTLFLLIPSTTLMFIWDFSLSKMYSICLIATLNARNEWNNLLTDRPADNSKNSKNSVNIIKIRRATDIQGLQLYIPSQFELASHAGQSPRKRTPRAEWVPQPLPVPAPASVHHVMLPSTRAGTQAQTQHGLGVDGGSGSGRHGHVRGKHSRSKSRSRDETESAKRTAEWAMRTGR